MFGLLAFVMLLWIAVSALLWTRRIFDFAGKGAAAADSRERHCVPVTDAFRPEEREWMHMHAVAMSASLVGWFVCAQFASVGYYWTFYYLFALIVAGRELTTDRIIAAHAATAPPRLRVAGAALRMTLRQERGRRCGGARLDAAMTRRDGRRRVLIDSRTAMNYVMAAPIQAALADDPRVQFYATASDSPAAQRARSTRGRCQARGRSRRGRSARSGSTPI